MFVVNQNLSRICALKLRFVLRQTWVDSAFTQSEHKFAYSGLWFGGGWYLVRELNPGVCCAFSTVFCLSASSAFSCLSICLSSSTSLSAPPPSLFIAERQSLVRRLPDCDADCKQRRKQRPFLPQTISALVTSSVATKTHPNFYHWKAVFLNHSSSGMTAGQQKILSQLSGRFSKWISFQMGRCHLWMHLFKQTISFSSEIGFLHSLNSQLPGRKIWDHCYRPITTLKITTKTSFGLWKVVLSPLLVSKRAFFCFKFQRKITFCKRGKTLWHCF